MTFHMLYQWLAGRLIYIKFDRKQRCVPVNIPQGYDYIPDYYTFPTDNRYLTQEGDLTIDYDALYENIVKWKPVRKEYFNLPINTYKYLIRPSKSN
jgi:hypothetical protein